MYYIDNASISKSCKDTEYKYSAGKHPETGEALIWQYYNEWLDNPKDHNKYVSEVERRSKKVICIETGVVYDTIKEACEDTGASGNGLWKACNNTNSTSGGYHWQYYEEYLTNPLNVNDIILKKANASKPVKCIETDIIYTSMTEAEKLTGVKQCGISQVCRGKRETAGGYHWEYVS